ncbi:MAG: hypothetical protein AXA67_06870 [Methylothermaceae bacteria B42]|nr:MAG: hypothetical protein AXA67_06870 [Methylothermaceae bacteria B42]
MKEKIGQWLGTFGAAFAAACCLGLPLALSAVTAVGLGFLINDAYLFPLFVGFIGLSLWLLYRNGQRRGNTGPFWLALGGGMLSTFALWFTVTGLSPQNWAIYTGLVVFIAGQIWDFRESRRGKAGLACPPQQEPIDKQRRLVTGAAVSVAAAGVFYGLSKSVERFAPQAEEGQIACWGINSCKGTTACATAFNACAGQNDCRGRGYLYVTPQECEAKGGVPLAGSEADPNRRSG